MFDHKIIVTGPVGAGKSTAIRTYSTSQVVETDILASDQTQTMKEATTVAMDYGTIVLDAETKVHLYGTPGQERFDFMWEILSKGSRGVIIVLNASARNPLQDLRFYLHAFADVLDRVPLVIGVNKISMEQKESDFIEKLQQAAMAFGSDADVLAVDIRKRKDMNKLVKRILFSDKLFAK